MTDRSEPMSSLRTALPLQPLDQADPLQAKLTETHLLPVLGHLMAFFLAVRAKVDGPLQAAQPVSNGKIYPLGQCLEITQAAERLLLAPDRLHLGGEAALGLAAFRAFRSAGGKIRQVWGDLRGTFFQNAFQIGTLYVDVSNDTVTLTKPKVEILPFAAANFRAIGDFRHFAQIARRYWKHSVFPNHVLPELAPFCPLIHVSTGGIVMFRDPTRYMVGLACKDQFSASEDVLSDQAIRTDLFEHLGALLRSRQTKLPASPEAGRQAALQACREGRDKRWHLSRKHQESAANQVHRVNRQLLARGQALPFAPARDVTDGLVLPLATDGSAWSGNRRWRSLSPTDHAGLRWQPLAGKRGLRASPLALFEIAEAILTVPFAFTLEDGTPRPVAILGLEQPVSHPLLTLLQRPAFVPAAETFGAFATAQDSGGSFVLAVDDASRDFQVTSGELLFNAEGKASSALEEISAAVVRLAQDRPHLIRALTALWQANILRTASELVAVDPEGRLPQLLIVDPIAFAALPQDVVHELRNSGAYTLAQCQILSMAHIEQD
jgi:hypothetical protein